jgi:LPXTG-motif cell wall-anchored protein
MATATNTAMRRSLAAAGVFAALLVLLSASSAAAHAVFVGTPSGVPVDTDQALVMNVPHERGDDVYNVEVTVAMPAGWQPLSCQVKDTWTCELTTLDGRRVVHFVKSSGAPPAEDETFGFSVHTATTVGSFSFPTVQKYSSAEIVRWISDPGTEEPAPVLRTIATGTTAPPSTPTTAPEHSSSVPTTVRPAPTTSLPTIAPTTASSGPTESAITTTSSTTSTTTTPSSIVATTDPPTNGPGADRTSGGSGTSAPLVVGAIVGGLALAAGLLARRRRRRPETESTE